MSRKHKRPQHGFSSIALVLTLFVLVGFIAHAISFNSELDLNTNVIRKRQNYRRIALSDLVDEAYYRLADQIARGDRPSYDNYGISKFIQINSMDDLKISSLGWESEDGNERVSVYDLSFDVNNLAYKPAKIQYYLRKYWGHREQDFYTPIPGAYLIRAVVEPLDEYAPEKLLEVVWALDESGQLELRPRSKQEF